MLRQVDPNSLRYVQHAQANALLARCNDFSQDYDTLKWEFAPNKTFSNTKLFDEITGKDDIKFAILRENICHLVDTTKEALDGRTDAGNNDVINDLKVQLDWMVKQSRLLMVELEGENGHTYRDGTPKYHILGPTKSVHLLVQQPQQALNSYGMSHSDSNPEPAPQPFASSSTLGSTPAEEIADPFSEIQTAERTPRTSKLLQELQELESRNDYLEQELGSERYDKEELREELERMQAEYAKLNGGKRFQKPRPAYLEEAMEASINKANAWVRNSRSGEVERRPRSSCPSEYKRDIFSDPEQRTMRRGRMLSDVDFEEEC